MLLTLTAHLRCLVAQHPRYSKSTYDRINDMEDSDIVQAVTASIRGGIPDVTFSEIAILE